MAVTLTKCPECESYDINTLEIIDPNTHNMNSQAKLECQNCKHIWQGLVLSKHYHEQYHKGFII